MNVQTKKLKILIKLKEVNIQEKMGHQAPVYPILHVWPRAPRKTVRSLYTARFIDSKIY